MQYVIAFIIFLLVVYIFGILFSFLWPLLVLLVLAAAVLNLIAYYKRNKAAEEFYKNAESNVDYDFFQNRATRNDDQVIDVEYTETSVDEDR